MRGLFGVALVCSGIALVASPGAAQEDEWAVPPPAWEGVWKGAIGSSPVHVCLDKTPSQQKGAYYYDRVKRLLRLVPGKADDEWFEQEIYDKNAARWRISVRDGALVGTWSDGKKELPMRLSRIGGSSKEYEGPCASMAFHRPRLAPVRLTSKHATKNGAGYTSWTFKPGAWFNNEVEISTFTIDRPDAQASRVNSLLRTALPKSDGAGEWLDCVASNINWSGMDGTYFKIIEPTLISKRWLAANEFGEYYCGGAHPDNVSKPRTFDLARGIEVDPLDWFGSKAVHREDLGGKHGIYKTLTPAFVAMILEGFKDERSECDEATRTQESWSVGIERGALVFSPNFPRVIMDCGEKFTVPLARLRPWLNRKGMIAVATLPR